MRPEVLVSALAALAACQGDAPAQAAPGRVIEAHGPDGTLVARAAVAGGECAIDKAKVHREGAAIVGRVRGEAVGRVTAEGDVILGDRRVLRTVRGDGRFDLIDPDGVPVARISVRDGQAKVADAARRVVAAIRPEGERIVVTGADGAPALTVTGTTDLVIAALFLGSDLVSARHLLVCERLLDDTPPGPHDRRANQHP